MPIVSSLGGEYGFGLQPQPRLATSIRLTPQVNKKSSHDFDLDGDFIISGNTLYNNPDILYTITPNVNVTVGFAIWGGGGGGSPPGYNTIGGTGGAVFGTLELKANRKYDFVIGAPGQGVDNIGAVADSAGGAAASLMRDQTNTLFPIAIAGGGGGGTIGSGQGHAGGLFNKSDDYRYNGNIGSPITKGGDGLGNPAGGLPGSNGYGYSGGRGSSSDRSGGGGGGSPGGFSANVTVSSSFRGGWGGMNAGNVENVTSALTGYDLGYTHPSTGFDREPQNYFSLPYLWDHPKAQTLLLPTRTKANSSGNLYQYNEWRRSPVTTVHAGSTVTFPDMTVGQHGMIRLWIYEHNAVKFTSNLDTPANNKIIKEGSLSNGVGYKQIKFLSNGHFFISNPGINDTIEILSVGAGGNGGIDNYYLNGGQGGDAGRLSYQVVPAYAGLWSVKVGSSGSTRTVEDKASYVVNPYASRVAFAFGGDDGGRNRNNANYAGLVKSRGLFVEFYNDYVKERLGTPGNRGIFWTNTGGIDWAGTVTTYPSLGPGGGASSQDGEPNTGGGGGGGIDYGEWVYDKPPGYGPGLGGSGTVFIRYCTRSGGQANELKPMGSTLFSDGIITGYLYRITNSDYYRVANTPWTIEFWCYLLNYPGDFFEERAEHNSTVLLKWIILADDDGSGSGRRWQVHYFDESSGYSSRIREAVVSNVDATLKQWTHVAFVYDGTTSGTHTKIYINGIDCTKPPDSPGMQFPYPSGWPTRTDSDYHRIRLDPNQQCYISNFRYVKKALYTGNFVPSKANFVGNIGDEILVTGVDPFEERAGYYLTGNVAYTGVQNLTAYKSYWDYRWNTSTSDPEQRLVDFAVSPKFVAASSFSPATVITEIKEYSAYFNTQNPEINRIECALSLANSANFDFSVGPNTFEMWLYPIKLPTPNANICRILRFGNHGSMTSFVAFQITYHGIVSALVPKSSDATGLSTPPYSVDLNVWQHFALVQDINNTGRIYKNGILLASGPLTSPSSANNTCFIGQDSYANVNGTYNGYINNLRVVKGAALYTGDTITVPTEPLTAIPGTVLLTCNSATFVDNSPNAATITAIGLVRTSTVSPFDP